MHVTFVNLLRFARHLQCHVPIVCESRLRFNFPQRRVVSVEFSKLLAQKFLDTHHASIMFPIHGRNGKLHEKVGCNGMYQLIRAGALHALRG